MEASGGGGSAAFLLFLLFLGLKLGHVINWSWWWITAPLWGGFALLAVGIFIALIVAILFK